MYEEPSRSKKPIDHSRLLKYMPGGPYRSLLEERIEKIEIGRKVTTIIRRRLSQTKK